MKVALAITIAGSARLALATGSNEIVGSFGQLAVDVTNSTAHSHVGVNAVQEDYCLVAQNLDMTGVDLLSRRGDPETCCTHCKSYSTCNAYVWTDYQGGTCWLKKTTGEPNIYIGARGCVVGSNAAPSVAHFSNCDMPGNDLLNLQTTDKARCELICWAGDTCKAVIWTNYQGGTCWLKSAVTNCVYYPGATAAVVFNEGRFGPR